MQASSFEEMWKKQGGAILNEQIKRPRVERRSSPPPKQNLCIFFPDDQEFSWGEKQEFVTFIQSFLLALGIDIGLVDGILGRRTCDGLVQFQIAYDLNQTGFVDPDTAAKIAEILEEAEREEGEKEKPDTGFAMVEYSSGSGYAVTQTGLFVTNEHVIDDCDAVRVENLFFTSDVGILTSDKTNDIAILQSRSQPPTHLSLSPDDPNILDEIIVAGYPFGDGISSGLKVTKGIVSAEMGIDDNYGTFQFDAAIQPGNSGGPILNENGYVVGTTVSKLNPDYYKEKFGAVPEASNFGVKASIVATILSSVRDKYVYADKKIKTSDLRKLILESTYLVICLKREE